MAKHLPRKLAVIVHADVVGSTTLVQLDESVAHDRIQDVFRRFSETINRYGGNAHEIRGDALVAGFDRASDAVSAALAFQVSNGAHNQTFADEIRPEIRIGISLGEVIIADGTITGAGVVIAQRLEQLSGPGGVVVQGSVSETVPIRMPFEFESLGEQELKGFDQPVRAFVVQLKPGESLPEPALQNFDVAGEEPPATSPLEVPSLPAQRHVLIGREQELLAAEALVLRKDVGLLTLTGPGGSGKTRLSLEIASELMEHFQGQVFFIALAPIRDPDLVALTINKTLGIQDSGSRPPLESLKHFVRDKSLLLVLDNFEQILGAAPQLAELLSASPFLKILVTSRAALQIRDEQEFPVPPLALPATNEPATPAALLQCASVAMFIERAAAIKPGFAITEENAATLAQICVRLDGLPLAIELAAARVRSLSPSAMLGRLEHRLPLLTGGARDLPARQQTLRATIAWSYDLLDITEQQLCRCLAVFVGGCTLQAIAAVYGGNGESGVHAEEAVTDDIVNEVESLIAKNLLRQVEGNADEPRFLMLETIREYGLEQLEECGEAPAVQRRHAKYFLMLAEQADPNLRGPNQPQWLDRLEAEHANLRAAMAWSQQPAADAELGLRIAAVLAWFWRLRGYLTEGRSWLEAILNACPDRTALRSKALARTTLLTYGQGDSTRAKALAEESVAIAREVGDDSAIGWALHAMGRALHSNAEYERAAVVLQESLERFRATGDIVGCSYSSWYLGDVTRAQGDYERSAPLMEDGLLFARRSGDTWALASAYLNAGTLAYRQKDFDRASALLKESLVYFRNIRAVWGMWFPVSNLGVVAAAQGYAKRAACLAGADKTLGEAIGVTMTPSHRTDYEEGITIARRALGESAFEAAWSRGMSMTSEQAVDYALSCEDESLA